MENFRLRTAQVKLHQICTLIGYFPESMEELCLRIPESHSVHPPPPSFSTGELSLQPNFKKGGDLTGPQLLQRGCWERGG